MSTKAERTASIEALVGEFTRARGIFVTDINRLTVAKVTKLRSDLRKQGSRYIVTKNTLAKIALERSGKKGLASCFKGPVGVAIGYDEPAAPIKIISDFQKENADILPVKGAYFEGTIFNAADALKLASLPSKEVLLAQLLSVLQAPMANLAGTLSALLGMFVRTLDAVKRQKEEA